MKRFYETPEIDVILLNAADIMNQSDDDYIPDSSEDINIRDDNEGPMVTLP